MAWKKSATRTIVEIERGNVVLTISPSHANQIAMVIDGTQPHQEWVQEVVRSMLGAADRLGTPSNLVPRLSRRDFLRNWQPGAAPTAMTSPLVAGANEAGLPHGAFPVASTGLVSDTPAVHKREVAASLVQAAAVHAAELAQDAVDTAANRAAEAALTARDQRSAAVEDAAEVVATRVAKAAAATESEVDAAALMVAQAAFDSAFLIASTVEPGSERDAALTATLVATAVAAIAIKTAAVAAAARADIAREAAAAAVAAAVAAADAAKIVDLEVAYAAQAVRNVATQTALTLAEQTDAEATAFALNYR